MVGEASYYVHPIEYLHVAVVDRIGGAEVQKINPGLLFHNVFAASFSIMTFFFLTYCNTSDETL